LQERPLAGAFATHRRLGRSSPVARNSWSSRSPRLRPRSLGIFPLSERSSSKTLADKGDLAAARTRIKDLEVSWTKRKPDSKPGAAADSHVVGKAIDKALAVLRADKPDHAACHQSVAELLDTVDKISGRA
jgi:hypothetical protein